MANKAAAALSKRRMTTMTKEERSEVARKAAAARWEGEESALPRAVCGSMDKPLRIGEVEIPCFVLNDETRVLTQRGLQMALGFNRSGGARRLTTFVGRICPNPARARDITLRIENPIEFAIPGGGRAHGYEAELLPQVCTAVLEAERAGLLHPQHAHVAAQCSVIVNALAQVGIIALVDEVTGHEDVRASDALAKILERLISEEMRRWLPTFGPDFYKQVFRLHGWKFDEEAFKKDKRCPWATARFTADVVYKRLAPGVLEKLREVVPKDEKGRREGKLHQMLTANQGYPMLKEHLAAVVALMSVAPTKEQFMEWLDQVKPIPGENMLLAFTTPPPT